MKVSESQRTSLLALLSVFLMYIYNLVPKVDMPFPKLARALTTHTLIPSAIVILILAPLIKITHVYANDPWYDKQDK